jgi:3-hydroxy-D-aspartate aldolase
VDSGLPTVFGNTDLTYVKCSDEHGVIADPKGILKINDKLKLVPGHCDPTCNIYDWFVGVRNEKVECLWPITARGLAL